MTQEKLLKRIRVRLMPESRPSERSLRGIGLWLARFIYLLALVGIMALFFVGSPAYVRSFQQGYMPMKITRTAGGDIEITEVHDEVAQAGIQAGDILLAVNGATINAANSIEQVDSLLFGPIGQNVTLTVRTQSAGQLDVTIQRGQVLLQTIQNIHLSLPIVIIFFVTVSTLMMLSFALISLLIFIRRSDDWYVILVALTLIILPLTLSMAPQLSEAANQLHAYLLFEVVSVLGQLFLISVLYLFPRGQLIPRWLVSMIILAIVLTAFSVTNSLTFLRLPNALVNFLTFWPWVFFFAIGILSQMYRYRRVYNRIERQQTKWVIIGLVISLIVFVLGNVIYILPSNALPAEASLLLVLSSTFVIGLAFFFFAVSLIFAMFHYKLWDTDFYINRTIIYGLVTGILAVIWAASVALLNYAFQQFTDKQSPLIAAVLSSIQVVALFQPLRDRIETWINARFYKDRVDFTKAVVELHPENWQFITPDDLYGALTESTGSLLKSDKAVLYLLDSKAPRVVSSIGLTLPQARQLKLDEKVMDRLKEGKAIQLPDHQAFAVLVPLIVPRGRMNDLIGLLALGQRGEERGYSRDHLSDLSDLGESAGTAIHFLQLNQKKLNSKN